MKVPLTDEVIHAPAQYVGTFFYNSHFSVSLTKQALEQQCNGMLAQHFESQSFEDFESYVAWVRETGNHYIEALEKDFKEHADWWKNSPDITALRERIKLVLKKASGKIRIYSND